MLTTREQARATRRKHIKMTTLDHAPVRKEISPQGFFAL